MPVPPGVSACPADGTFLSTPSEDSDEAGAVLNAWVPTETKDPLLGSRLGEYQVTARLGLGGMGIVYEGVQPLIGKRVAIKVLRWEVAADDGQMERLLMEARSVNAIRHRGIIDIFGFGELPDGRHYFVMEYLEGHPLNRVIAAEAPLPVKFATSLIDDVLASLDAAHRAGVIHRDLKPSNVFVVREPSGVRYAKLLDFGLAKQGPLGGGITPQSQVSMVVGTPGYMPPEQARGDPVSPQTDLYSLGVVAFEMLTGQTPFAGKTFFDVVAKQTREPPPPPSRFNSAVPPALDELVIRLLSPDPANRPRTAEDVQFELRRVHRGSSPHPLVTSQQALEVTQEDDEQGSMTAPMTLPETVATSESPTTRREKSASGKLPSSVSVKHSRVRWILALIAALSLAAGFISWRIWLARSNAETDVEAGPTAGGGASPTP